MIFFKYRCIFQRIPGPSGPQGTPGDRGDTGKKVSSMAVIAISMKVRLSGKYLENHTSWYVGFIAEKSLFRYFCNDRGKLHINLVVFS